MDVIKSKTFGFHRCGAHLFVNWKQLPFSNFVGASKPTKKGGMKLFYVMCSVSMDVFDKRAITTSLTLQPTISHFL